MPEYWVINAGTLAAMVHKHPSAQVYGLVQEVPPGDMLVPSLVPAFAVSLGTLDLG